MRGALEVGLWCCSSRSEARSGSGNRCRRWTRRGLGLRWRLHRSDDGTIRATGFHAGVVGQFRAVTHVGYTVGMRLAVLCCFALISCSPVSPDRFRFVELPQSFELGVAGMSIQTTTGDVYVSTIRGSWLRMKKGATAWENLGQPGLSRTAPDFQQGKALGLLSNNTGVAVETATGFMLLDPPVNAPPTGALLGRDTSGVFWSTSSSATHVLLSKWDAASTTWTTENLAYDLLPAGTETALTGTGSVFMRPANKGLFEADREDKRLVERVPCTHAMFRPSHPDFRACQQDSTLVGDVDAVLIATANHEVWRVSPGASEPVLVVKGDLQGVTLPVDANGNSIVGIPQVHLDSKRRVWLIYRFGLNVGSDVSELHVADLSGAPPATWQRLRGNLERNMRLFGVGPTPVLSTGSEDQGLRVVRIEE